MGEPVGDVVGDAVGERLAHWICSPRLQYCDSSISFKSPAVALQDGVADVLDIKADSGKLQFRYCRAGGKRSLDT